MAARRTDMTTSPALQSAVDAAPQPTVSPEARQKLIRFFAEHPAWMEAARPLGEGVCSHVRFAGDDTDWNLVRRAGVSVLEPGEPVNPDFFFAFTEGAIAYLTEDENANIGDFATRMYECCFLLDEDRRIDFQIVSPITQILRHGYWKIAIKGGWKVMRIARAHGIGSLRDFQRVLGLLRGKNSSAVREAFLAQRRD